MIKEIKDPEIIIGIVGAVGTDLNLISRMIEDELKVLDYNTETIKLSATLTEFERYKHLKDIKNDEYKRIESFMDAGDDFREKLSIGAALAFQGIAAIREFRFQKASKHNTPISKQAYVLKSLKRPEEVNHLRKIYGKLFMLFSVYSPRDQRLKKLSEDICRSKADSDPNKYLDDAEKLIARDDKSGHKDYGQDVQEAFPLGDFFIKMDVEEEVRFQVKRFLNTWFGHPFISPSKDEYGMYFANATAKRSADLSRQVGAAIMSKEGNVITVGCNEVPKFSGGIAWDGDEGDYRDFQIGRDQNVSIKDDIVKELFSQLKENGWLSQEKNAKDVIDLMKESLYPKEAPLRGTRLASLLEFGRIVHAEMNALMDAARRGLSVQGATLYCTTFPCHMCARHIVSSGITRVVFVEPYPKSLTEELYSDIVSVDERGDGENKVKFESFFGLSPNIYIQMFQREKRKHDDGYAYTFEEIERYPRVALFRATYLDFEAIVVGKFVKEIQEKFAQMPLFNV